MEDHTNEGQPVIGIVDDNDSVRAALRRLVESMGFRARTFASCEEFMVFDQRDKTDCLVLDVMLPGMTGLELHDWLITSGSRIPVIFITAHSRGVTHAKACKADAVAFLEKPFNDGFFLEAVRAAIKQRMPNT